MSAEILTKEDLEAFRLTLLRDVKKILLENLNQNTESLEGLKTSQVKKILRCTENTLQSLRISGVLRVKKIGGSNYYSRKDIEKLLNEGFKSMPKY